MLPVRRAPWCFRRYTTKTARPVYKTPEDALQQNLKSNMRVYVHMAAATPTRLLQALASCKHQVKNVEVVSLHLEGSLPHLAPDCSESFRHNAFFCGSNIRKAVNEGRADYTPVFFSEVPKLFREGVKPLDVALVQVSPPDKHGFCSLGVSVDCSVAAVTNAKFVVAQVNKHMPRTHGAGIIHVSHLDALVEHHVPLFERENEPLSEIAIAIGKNVASLIPDGATLQMGIGEIPNATLNLLTNHKNLGIHSEMFSDGVIELINRGVVTNSLKQTNRGQIVSTFLYGSKRLYDFVDDNPIVTMAEVDYVNDPTVIASNPAVHAINSAIEVDLTGQVVADSIGEKVYSGVGGQMDFMRGAAMSKGGKPIIALPSVTSKGESRIVPFIKQGAGVVTTRAHVHYVVTEHGIANLYGQNVRERALALVKIAHPSHRERLMSELTKRFGSFNH